MRLYQVIPCYLWIEKLFQFSSKLVQDRLVGTLINIKNNQSYLVTIKQKHRPLNGKQHASEAPG